MLRDTLFKLTAIATYCCAAGCNTHTAQNATAAFKPGAANEDEIQLGRNQGTATRGAAGHYVELYFSDARFSAGDLQRLDEFPYLRELKFVSCSFDDSIWQPLRGMADLEILTLWRGSPPRREVGITDEGMAGLRSLPKLKSLDLRGNSIGDAGLAHIAQLNQLEELELLGTRVTSEGLAHLRGLTNLRKLGLIQTAIGDEGLQYIRGLTGLTELTLESTRITNGGLAHVGQLTNLEMLSIHNTAIDENGLVHLEQLTNLRTFYLCVPVSKAGLASLKKMSSLRDLYIADEESRKFLESQLPGVGVY